MIRFTIPWPAALLARAAFAGVHLTAAAYCLLTYVPFTYQQGLHGGVLPGLNWFGRVHHWWWWAALPLLLAASPGMALPAVYAAAGVVLGWRPVLAGLPSNTAALWWAVACLAPVAWLGLEDLRRGWKEAPWRECCGNDAAVLHACWQTAVLLTGVYWLLGSERSAAALIAALTAHLLVFGMLFAALGLLSAAANNRPRIEYLLLLALGAAWLAAVVLFVVFPQISLGGWPARTAAGVLAFSVTLLVAGSGLRLPAPPSPTPLGLALRAVAPVGVPLWLAAPALSAVAWLLAARAAALDWQGIGQRSAALLMGLLAFAVFYQRAARHSHPPLSPLWLAATLPALGGHVALESRVEAGDVSTGIIRAALSARKTDASFYDSLAHYTNLPRSTRVADPPPLVDRLSPPGADRPHIFLLVIDSLRQDHVGPYRAANDLTPAITGFARDSVVFENAFTPYGGTGLSEPAIWTGGWLPHVQYPAGFERLNHLEKLLAHEGYQRMMSRDTILAAILKRQADDADLDAGVPNSKYDLCRTLEELQGRLAARPAEGARPLFVYTQPQNLHVSVIHREGSTYQERLKRIDGCFGRFAQTLRDTGYYERSIIIVTSDHGDSLGEQGRLGHAYTIYPEILRIPLIIHLPPRLRLAHDPRAVAFSTDLTPSLYYLLGHRPIRKDGMLGRPLFTADLAEQAAYRREYWLVASSYASVYGVLRANTLYIADGVNYRDHLYRLDGAALEPDAATKELSERLIRESLQSLHRAFGLP